MALKPCPECGNEVSKEAASCPKCGHPLKKEKKPMVSRPAGLVLQLIALGLFIAAALRFFDESSDPGGAIVLGLVALVFLYLGGGQRPGRSRWDKI